MVDPLRRRGRKDDEGELRRLVADLTAEVQQLRAEQQQTAQAAEQRHADLETRIDRLMTAVRFARDDDAATIRLLAAARATDAYRAAFTEPDPLVSVVIPTYRNFDALRERALPSIQAQTHQNWEVVIAGDGAPDATAEVVAAWGDPRVRYVNRPYRGPYPEDPADAWHISGTQPFNLAVGLATGHWIAPLADDDAFTPDHIEVLLAAAREAEAEVAVGDLAQHHADGSVTRLGAWPPARGGWGLQGTLFHRALSLVPVLESDWIFHIPNDWSVCERWLRAGVRFARVDAVVAEYFPSWDFGGRSERWSAGEF